MSSKNNGHISAIKCLVSFFTILHLNVDQDNMDAMEHNFYLVPIIGLIFGQILIVELSICSLLLNRFYFGGDLLQIIILATVYLGSRFLHFDGLTDFGDGIIVAGEQTDHIRALKDTLVGQGGVGTSLIVVLLSFSIYSMCGCITILIIAPIAEIMIRNSMLFTAAKGIAGKGMASQQVKLTTIKTAFKGLIVSIICAILLVLLSSIAIWVIYPYIGQKQIMYGFYATIVGIIVSTITGYYLANISNKTFGMVNGDILGASNEISRPIILLSMALMISIQMVV